MIRSRNILDFHRSEEISFCYRTPSGAPRWADDAVRIARLAASAGLPNVGQAREFHPRPRTILLPDPGRERSPPAAVSGEGRDSPSCPTSKYADPVVGKAIAGRWQLRR